MYRIEIFDEKMDFVSACYTDDAQTISIDYLAYDPFQITVQAIEAKKGYFAHITGKNNELVADCIIADVQPDKEQQELSLRPLQALFDVGVFYSPVSDAITWLGNNLTDQFVTNADTLQRRPLNITATAGSRSFPLTGYNLNPTINILSVITNAFATWGIVTEAFLDLSAKEIVVNIFEQVAEQTIECDLDNIISAEITLGDSYGSTNKLTIRKTVEEGTPTGTTEITYYRHTDGSINTTDDDRIVPVFWEVATIEQTSDMTDAQWIQETFTKAKEVLSVGHYDNEVILSVWEDDKIINPRSIEIGTITTLLLKGETYYSILTGYQVEGSIITLTFGAVRTELTKKLSIQNRGSSSSSSSSGGGGGGGGGGAVTGVKGNEEILYRVGDVNLTPADIGAVPTTTTINGHALSSNVTITKADVGLGNVDNTADLDKPVSDAVQSALDDKVDKETGKGLSTNDFTNALLTKLNGIEAGAQVNTVTGVKGSAESSYRTGNVSITKANIGLGNVNNTSDANKPISTATQTALDGKVDKETGKSLTSNDFTDALLAKLNGIESGAQVNTVTGVKGNSESTYRTGNINITKANIGLGNVDNTSDANKPISTATQTALDGKVSKTGDTMTGTLVVPVVQTGSTEANYFQTRKMRGEGSASTYYHAIDFGYAGHNQVDFYEYGGLWNFYKNTTADGSGKVLVGKISANGWEGNVVGDVTGNASSATTASKATADGSGNNIVDTYATKTALDNKVDKVTGKGLSTNDFTTAEKNKLSGIESGAQVNTITGVKGNAESSYRTGNVNLTKANIGLGNVDNTSDANKPISTATQTALNAKVNKTDIATTSDLGLVMPDGTSITIDADGTIHSVGGGGGGGGSSNIIDSLWTNSSPTTAFTAKTVSLSLSPYAFVFIKIREATTLAKYSWHIVAVGDSNTFTTYADYFIRARSVSVSTSGVTFGSGLYYPRYAEDSPSTGDAQCVPVEIWGLRKVGGGSGSISYYESQTTSVASNAEILRITDSSITTATIVLECTFASPSAISGDVSWTSYNGYIAFTGTCTSATTANVTLADKTN